MTAVEAARLVGGQVSGTEEVLLTGADVDSRRVRCGDLFVALPGERRDGHEFVGAALATAAAALVRADAELEPPPPGRALIRSADPLTAYWELARHDRCRRQWQVVAVTGSVGKTTVKEFLVHLLARHRRTGATAGNRNSTLGLPGELLSQPEDVELFVAEAGMSRPGELATLGAILEPLRLLLYTRIAPVHTEFFPDLDGIVRAKAELIPYLEPEGTLVINAADPRQLEFADATPANVFRYGSPSGEAWIEGVEDRGLLGTRFELVLPDGRRSVDLGLAGRHQADNLLAAAAAVCALGIGIDAIVSAAATLRPARHRGTVHRLAGEIVLVDDSYNASPVAMERLLELLAGCSGRRVAVLGEMYELGELTDEAHAAVGTQAAASCDLLVAVGGEPARMLARAAQAAGLAEVHHVDAPDAATRLLLGLLEPGDVVLVKGSRGVGLDRTVAELVPEEAA